MITSALASHALEKPDHTALVCGYSRLSYSELWLQVSGFAQWLEAHEVTCLGIALANGLPWVIADLAAMQAGISIVPIPEYFTPAQVSALEADAGIDCVLSPRADKPVDGEIHLTPGFEHCSARMLVPERRAPAAVKITFTSGSTGSPRGVVLTHETLAQVALGIVEGMRVVEVNRHLCVLPLATLLENVAGVYAPLIKGIEVWIPTPEASGLQGSSNLDIGLFAECINHSAPQSLILVPQLLMALTTLAELEMVNTDSLRMVAVGGGKVAGDLLDKAERLGIPAFEGYGLSEAGSVVTLNLPGAARKGTSGRVLPHAGIRVRSSGELEVRGPLMTGYLAGQAEMAEWLPTGDLAEIDEDGYLTIYGRRKNLFITSYGRNVNPEWVEAELLQHPVIAQAMLHGEARESNLALIWPRFETTREALAELITAVNASLPDYARVHDFLIINDEPGAELVTANGRLRRDAVTRACIGQIEAHYADASAAGNLDHNPVHNHKTSATGSSVPVH